jgi:hypothetical protein
MLIWAAARKPHSVSLRFTARGLRRPSMNRQRKVQALFCKTAINNYMSSFPLRPRKGEHN